MQPSALPGPNQPLSRLWARIVPHATVLAAAAGALVGAGVFLGMSVNPPLWIFLVLAGFSLLALGVVLWAGAPWVRPLGAFGIAVALFFHLAALQVDNMPPIPYAATAKHGHWVVGPVVRMAPKPENPARSVVVLSPVKVYQTPGFTPQEAHIGVPTRSVEGVKVGEALAIPTAFLPPQGDTRPGGFDARWYRFFNRNILYGYSVGAIAPTALPVSLHAAHKGGVAVLGGAVVAWVERARAHIFASTQTQAQGTVAALLMGSTKAIPSDVAQAYRATGLTHLLAISGMQLTLVGLGLFFLVRWGLAWLPALALRINTKQPAAWLGFLGAGGYALLAGGGVSVVRALAMVAIVLLAAVVGRFSQALRVWALAVLGLVALNPAMVMNAGFQLSIAAVLGLLVYDAATPKRHPWEHPLEPETPFVRLRNAITPMVAATVVAGAATAPILVAQFGQLTPLSLPANIVAIPLMILATYAGFIALLLWPLGLQGIALVPMEALCTLTNQWAMSLAYVPLPGAVMAGIPLFGIAQTLVLGLSLLTSAWILGGMVLHRPWVAWSGVGAAVVVALGAPSLQPPPELLLWNGGLTGWGRAEGGTAYHLLWSDDIPKALQEAQRARLPLAADAQNAPPTPTDALALPPVPEGAYAWAARTQGRWHVQPLTCTRPWQAADERCLTP